LPQADRRYGLRTAADSDFVARGWAPGDVNGLSVDWGCLASSWLVVALDVRVGIGDLVVAFLSDAKIPLVAETVFRLLRRQG
jgi:hypothetical protein